MVTAQQTPYPGLQRTLRGLEQPFQQRITERYKRLLPLLGILLRPRDIYERNRAWPGVRPVGKEATTYLSPTASWRARDIITAYAAQSQEDSSELWDLFYAYCRYGPIGLVDALGEDVGLAPHDIQAYAQFLRLGKHPRSDAGVYVRELLDAYAVIRRYPPPPPFVSRYLWASNRLLDRWFFSEQPETADQPKTTRRINLNILYPHCRWLFWTKPLGVECRINNNGPKTVDPWICGLTDLSTNSMMGFQISINAPSPVIFGMCLRQAIWHFGNTWWPARGVPDAVVIQSQFADIETQFMHPLRFLHCQIIQVEDAIYSDMSTTAGVDHWLEQYTVTPPRSNAYTCSELMDSIKEAVLDNLYLVSTRSTPMVFVDDDACLPWGHELSSALLLPSGGRQQVTNGIIHLFDVPFDASSAGYADGCVVDVRFDLWDARYVYLVDENTMVRRAPACAFEHRTNWLDVLSETHLSLLSNYFV